MLSLADKVVRAARSMFVSGEQPALWTVSNRGHVVGLVVCEAGQWRLSWFSGADRRLLSFAGPVDGDIDGLADALAARVGSAVELDSLPV